MSFCHSLVTVYHLMDLHIKGSLKPCAFSLSIDCQDSNCISEVFSLPHRQNEFLHAKNWISMPQSAEVKLYESLRLYAWNFPPLTKLPWIQWEGTQYITHVKCPLISKWNNYLSLPWKCICHLFCWIFNGIPFSRLSYLLWLSCVQLTSGIHNWLANSRE